MEPRNVIRVPFADIPPCILDHREFKRRLATAIAAATASAPACSTEDYTEELFDRLVTGELRKLFRNRLCSNGKAFHQLQQILGTFPQIGEDLTSEALAKLANDATVIDAANNTELLSSLLIFVCELCFEQLRRQWLWRPGKKKGETKRPRVGKSHAPLGDHQPFIVTDIHEPVTTNDMCECIDKLVTAEERMILHHVANNVSSDDGAAQLGLGPRTYRRRRRALLERLREQFDPDRGQ